MSRYSIPAAPEEGKRKARDARSLSATGPGCVAPQPNRTGRTFRSAPPLSSFASRFYEPIGSMISVPSECRSIASSLNHQYSFSPLMYSFTWSV